MSRPTLILASASPRRKQLLQQIGVSCIVQPAHLDETPLVNESALAYVQRMACGKAHAVASQHESDDLPVLGSDTSVIVDDHILGKPVNQEDCQRMLTLLSNRWHEVVSGVCLYHHQKPEYRVSITRVRFRSVTMEEIDAYWQTGEPQDKAGSYAIQGLGAVFVQRIEGSFSGVMGLPIEETFELLRQHGIPVWRAV